MDNKFFHEKTNHDGRPVLEIKCFADVEIFKDYVKKKIDVRVIIKPKQCIDKYVDLVKAMNEAAGKDPASIQEIRFKDETKN